MTNDYENYRMQEEARRTRKGLLVGVVLGSAFWITLGVAVELLFCR